MKTTDHERGFKAGRDLLVLVSAAVLLSAIGISMLISRPAGALTGSVTSTTCYPASSCVTTTTSATPTTTGTGGFHLVLTISWSGGFVHWQVCGFPAAAVGTNVQLYLGQTAVTGAGSNGDVLAGGCTTDPNFPLCPSGTTSYLASAFDATFDGGVGTNTVPLTVTPIGCIANTAAAGAGSGTSTGALAFTGSDVFRLLVFAALAILIGYIIVRLNRIRHHTG